MATHRRRPAANASPGNVSRACAEGMVPRTVLIDEAVRATSPRQLVIVGAGLDTRPWRLGELGHTRVFSVDHPASQADCRRRVGALEPVGDGLTYVAVDLASEPLGPALAASGHDPAVPTTWLWEGVVPYLARRDVEATLGAMSACASKGSTLVAQYQDRSAIARMGRPRAPCSPVRSGWTIRCTTNRGAHSGRPTRSSTCSTDTGSASIGTRIC